MQLEQMGTAEECAGDITVWMKVRDYVKCFCFSLHLGQGKEEVEWEKRGIAWGDMWFL